MEGKLIHQQINESKHISNRKATRLILPTVYLFSYQLHYVFTFFVIMFCIPRILTL